MIFLINSVIPSYVGKLLRISENPDINYSRNYLKGVNELAKLIEKTKAILGEINIPTLVIQSRNDPVVNPNSGNIIFDKIASDKKEIFTPDIARHTIITGEDKFLVFEKIADFIKKYE
jgi:esterase/lipase